jgi:hypothetical protein
MTIFCSSPREDVSKQFRKRALELTMPIWTYDELVECRNFLYSNIIDIPYLRTRYFFLGGVPRLIFTNINKNAVILIRDAVQTSSVEKLKRLVNSSGSTPDGDISHRLILRHPSKPFRDTRQRYSSDYCASMILFKYRQEAQSTIVAFFYDTSNGGQFGGLRGHMFEILADPVIASGGPFQCRKLVRRGRGRPAKTTNSAAETSIEASFTVGKVAYIDSMDGSKGLKNQLLIPRSKNYESVDSWIIDDSNVSSSFQFTVSKSHSITTAVYTYGTLINLKNYYTAVYDDQVFKNFGYRDIQTS